MKPLHLTLALGTAAAALLSTGAYARNATVEDALRNRSDLTAFYQGLVNTGVINELKPNVPYTIFAPTNEALAKLNQNEYPCFYSASCKQEAANILRNHIIPEEVAFNGPSVKGVVFAIDGDPVSVGEPNKNQFTVDGKNVISEYQLLGAKLVKIDGVIANPQELADISSYVYRPAMAEADGEIIRERTVTRKIYYSPDGRDTVGETSVVTKNYDNY